MKTETTLPTSLYRAAQVRELDQIAIQARGIPGYVLMNRAGASAFAAQQQRWPRASHIVVVCGGGNNAGDGYVIARLARAAGLRVQLFYLKDPATLTGDSDASRAWREATAVGVTGVPFDPVRFKHSVTEQTVIIDALLGTGLERELSGAWRDAVTAVNACPGATLSVDIPSGLNADCGTVMGAAVRAQLTVSFIGLKIGLFTNQGPEHCGEVKFAGLGLPPDVATAPTARLYQGSDLARQLPPRPRGAHKGSHGHALIIGGDHGYAGAVRLAGEAAARVGAGLVSVATRPEHAIAHAAQRPELMFCGVDAEAQPLAQLLARATVLAIGPGLGQASWGRALLTAALASHKPSVIDADALNLLAGDTITPVLARSHRILTPHPGEAARLLGCSTQQIQADRLAAAAAIVSRYGGVCVLKGAGSVIACAERVPVICRAGNPGMGSGGMGDVLTGVIAGLLAQGLTPWDAACVGVYLHAHAADLAARAGGERGLLAGDLLPWLRHAANPDATPTEGGP